jgi:hypothetical protein
VERELLHVVRPAADDEGFALERPPIDQLECSIELVLGRLSG